jgi:hypothetical protein
LPRLRACDYSGSGDKPAGFQRDTLHKPRTVRGIGIAAWFQTELAEHRSNVLRSDAFVVTGAKSTLHGIAREKAKFGTHISLENLSRAWLGILGILREGWRRCAN